MEKSILIKHLLQAGNEIATVPLYYNITKEENKTTVYCRVPEEKRPEWLTLTEFSIPSVYMDGSPGVTGTYLSHIKCSNVEEASFLGSVHKQIRLAEKWSERHQ